VVITVEKFTENRQNDTVAIIASAALHQIVIVQTRNSAITERPHHASCH